MKGTGRPAGSRAARRSGAALLAALTLAAPPIAAYETDQYTPRGLPLADAAEPLNGRVNEALVEIADSWRGPPDPARFARRIYTILGGRHWVDHIERWAMRSPEIDKFDLRRHGNIYSGLPWWARRVNFLFGLGPTLRVGDSLIGTDKLGHFFSQGWKYHKRYRRSGSVEHAVRLGNRNEASIFGAPFTGAFSNADLVANYEGLLFYRSLFEDGVVGGRPAIVEWTDGGARIRRPFDFRDHVNDYWDEALNPNRYDRLLRGAMRHRLEELCPRYAAHPEAWVAARDEELRRRYALLHLRDGTSHRLDRVCAAAPERDAPPVAGASHR